MNSPRGRQAAPRTQQGSAPARPRSAGPTLDVAAAGAKVAPARMAAFDILTLVSEGRGHSDELLHGRHTESLSAADRNLATALVMGVLRWEIALDAELVKHLARPDQQVAEPVAIALRLGAFQLRHMDRIPAHAALSESVELCRAAGEPFAAGMVNAILRKVAQSPAPGTRVYESTAAFAERLGHPLWLVERWVARYGRAAALSICEAGQREPDTTKLFASEASEEPPLPQIDEGSRLVAELAAAALQPEKSSTDGRRATVWDACAAPGGKTLVLAHRLPEASILATDVSTRRLAHTEARLRRQTSAGNVRCMVADAARLSESEGSFDLVLCDVPCSGTGTLARNPEIRTRLQPEELGRQAVRQRELLRAGLSRVAPGGRLVYSTCSLEPEENDAVVAEVLREGAWRQGSFSAVPGLVRPLESMLENGALRTLPGVHGCDGFYAVLLERA